MWHYSDSMLYAFEFFSKDGASLLKTGFAILVGCKTKETILEDDERIIGVKGRKNSDNNSAFYDF